MVDVQGAPIASARDHVVQLASVWNVSPLAVPVLDEVGAVRIPGGTITRVRQTIDGMPVWGGELRVLVRDNGELQTITGTLVGRDRVRSWRMIDDRASAVARAARGAHVDQALARTVWYPSGDALIAAWAVDAYTSDPASARGDATRTILAGDDGRVLERYSLEADAAFSYKVYAETSGEKHPLDGPQVDATPHPTGVPDGSYPAYLSAPNVVIVDGLDKLGDPWLAAGATETVGNNVDAYTDISAPSGLSQGDFRAQVTSPGAFAHVYDLELPPTATAEQQNASVTSLFYMINWLHDFWYDAGFTEAAGNAQTANYGRGGVEGDAILAEAQDNALGGSKNNANMSTPDDGMAPRMQVYVWSGKDNRVLTLQPSGDTPDYGVALFGPKNYDVTAQVVVGQDGQGSNVTDGCEPFTNNVDGKLVVVDRGNCTFKRKALNAQNADAVGVFIANNQASTTPPPLGDDSQLASTTITIPAISITQAAGADLEADIAAGTVTATLHRDVGVDLDGTLDSTLVAHEFGHYLHHRLTLCGNTMCRALSEGWGDFSSLMLASRPGDNLDGAYPFGIYVTQGFATDPAYFGIRRAPYSASFSINALSFRHMANGEPLPTDQPFLTMNQNAEVHNAGEIWASALWQAYVALQKSSSDFLFTRSEMARYVVAGLALTPTEASPMEARDALLAAVEASSTYDHGLMLDAFASRGFGSCAIPPPPASTDFKGIVESFIVAGKPEVATLSIDDTCDHDGVLDSGETAHLRVKVANRGHAPLTNVSVVVTSNDRAVSVDATPRKIGRLDASESVEIPLDVSIEPGHTEAIDGMLSLEVTGDGGCETTTPFPIAARLNVDDVEAASTTDSFDVPESIWTPWTSAWSHRRRSVLDGYWHGSDLEVESDTRLTSPPLRGSSAEPITITFRQSHSFEVTDGISYDGGVIEYSLDGDGNWHDLAELTGVPYTAVLQAETANALQGRPAFAGKNASYPDMDTVSLDLGMALADQTFQIRFRLGTDEATASEGWDIDDVAFTGIVGTPFPGQLPDDGVCDGDPPGDDTDDPILAGGGGCCDSGAAGGSALLSLGVLALVLRRRRR